MPTKLMSKIWIAALFVAVLGVFSGAVLAQSTTQGAIGGTVFDATGAVVGSATVTIHNEATNAEQIVKSDDSGNFNAPLLEPGSYTVTVAAAGFEGYSAKAVVVQVGQATTLLPHLTTGSSTTTVEVTAEAPALNFESPDFSTVLNQTALANIPINNRRWSALALTTPGVVPDSSGFGLVSVRGISTILNNIEIDGADDNQAYYSEERGRTREGYSTAGGAVREFQVNTGVYQAEYGRAAGGVINSVTKSGTNSFHGQVYGYDRESKWAAYNNYTTQTVLVNGANTVVHLKPEDLRKIYGFTVGGPLIKDKLFWMYTYDQHSHIFPAIATPSTPTNFYLAYDATAPGTEACNTTTGQITGLNASGGAPSAPDQEICLMAARLNSAGYGAFGGGNTGYAAAATLYTTDINNLNNQDLGSITRAGYQEINTPKLDWQVNSKEHVSALYHRLRWDSPGGVQTQNPVFYGIDTTGTDFVKLDYGVAKLTSLITPTISNELLFQYGRELNDEGQTPFSTYTKSNLIGPTGNVPEVVFSSTGGGLTFGSPYYSYRKALPDERKWQVEDTLYYNHGNHTFKFGADLLHNADLLNNTFESNGVYTYGYQATYFTDLYLSQNGYTGTGVCNAAASQVFAAGAVPAAGAGAPCYTSYVQGYGNPVFGINTFDWAVFAQDNWKVSPRLTLELGLRYDKEMLPTQQASYVNPAEIVNGVAVGNNHPSDNNNLGPRLGFSYDLFGSGKSVIRGGFGMYYGRLTNGVILNALLTTGFGPAQYTTSFNSTASSAVPAGPKFPNVAPASAGVALSPSVEYLDHHLQNPLVEEFDLLAQQEIGKGTVVSLSYLGALGKELTNFLDFNLNPNTEETVTVNVVDSTGKGPLGPSGTAIPVKVFTSYNTTGTSFGAITDVISNINSNYNALVAEVQNHSLHDLQFDVNYTWSHALDYNQNATTTTSTTNWLDPYANALSNYGNGNYNVPNRVVAYAVYKLPNFVEKKNWASYATNGWGLDDSFTASSGLPLSIVVSGNVATNKVLGGWNGGGSTTYIPNVGRNTIKYPRHMVDDIRVQKQIDFTERYNLQLFLNIFNVANHQNIDGLNTTGYAFTNATPTGTTPALVTATYQTTLQTVTSSNSSGFLFTPRELEIAAKFNF